VGAAVALRGGAADAARKEAAVGRGTGRRVTGDVALGTRGRLRSAEATAEQVAEHATTTTTVPLQFYTRRYQRGFSATRRATEPGTGAEVTLSVARAWAVRRVGVGGGSGTPPTTGGAAKRSVRAAVAVESSGEGGAAKRGLAAVGRGSGTPPKGGGAAEKAVIGAATAQRTEGAETPRTEAAVLARESDGTLISAGATAADEAKRHPPAMMAKAAGSAATAFRRSPMYPLFYLTWSWLVMEKVFSPIFRGPQTAIAEAACRAATAQTGGASWTTDSTRPGTTVGLFQRSVLLRKMGV